jgi:hypothetical protein
MSNFFELNLGEVESKPAQNSTKDFEPATKLQVTGDYNLVIKAVKPGKSSQKGTPQIGMKFVVENGEHNKAELWDTFYLTESSKWRLKELFAGSDKPELAETTSGFSEDDLKGLRTKGTVIEDEPYFKNNVEYRKFKIVAFNTPEVITTTSSEAPKAEADTDYPF